MLLIGAGLFLRSFQARQAVDPGFGQDPAAVMIVLVPSTRFDEEPGRRYTEGLLDRFRETPGVEDVGLITPMLLDPFRSSRGSFNVDGIEPPPDTDGHQVDFALIDEGFFPGEDPINFLYRPYSQAYSSFLRMVVRTSRDADVVGRELLSVANDYDPDFWAWELTTMERHIGVVAFPARASALVLTVFAAIAVALATIGLYGVVSYAVSQRAREIRIRMSLGAATPTVVRMLMATGLRAVAAGGAVGLLAALGLTRLTSSLLFGVSALDPLTFLGATLVLVSTAVAATWLPARRVSRVDPVAALRFE